MHRNNSVVLRLLALTVAVLGLAPAHATAEAACDTTFVTVAVTDAAGNPVPGSVLDSRDPGRVVGLTLSGPDHHLTAGGTIRPQGNEVVSFRRGGLPVFQGRYRADSLGLVPGRPWDVSPGVVPGDTLDVLAQWDSLSCGVQAVALGTVLVS